MGGLLASRAIFVVLFLQGKSSRQQGQRAVNWELPPGRRRGRVRGSPHRFPGSPCGFDAATLGRATDKLLKRKRQDVPSTSEVVFACLIFPGQGSRVKGWGLFIHLNLLVLLLVTPLRKYFGTILELDKTSWVLNSGLIRNILEFDLVFSRENKAQFPVLI